MCWIVAVVMVLAGRARADDAATVSVDGFVVDGVIAEGRVVYADRALPHALVRVVGARVVVITRADAHGHFHVNGLPPGAYRVELEHGAVADRAPFHEPRHYTLTDDRRFWCVLPVTVRTFEAVIGAARPADKQRPFIDTSSTALVTIFDGH